MLSDVKHLLKSHGQMKNVGGADHHAQPRFNDINNTTQTINGLSTFNLDSTLPDGTYKAGVIVVRGSLVSHCCILNVGIGANQSFSQAYALASFGIGAYANMYNAAVDAQLSRGMFNTNGAFIAIEDAYITGSILRIIFKNEHPGTQTLWVKGHYGLW